VAKVSTVAAAVLLFFVRGFEENFANVNASLLTTKDRI
jgi:hypothetical protein